MPRASNQSAQGFIASAQAYVNEIQAKIAISQGYANEAQVRLAVDTKEYEWLLGQQAKLQVDYDENYDLCQENEDEWITDLLGSEDDLVSEILNS